MPTIRRLAVLATAALFVLLMAGAAWATDEPTEPSVATDASVVQQEEQEATTGPGPAITVPAPVADEAPADWTYRYLIPTLLALAVVAVIATTVQYFVQVVRKRYKVVE